MKSSHIETLHIPRLSKKDRQINIFKNKINSLTNIIGNLMRRWMHYHNIQARNFSLEKWARNNNRNQKQANSIVVSSPGDRTIISGVKYNSVPDN